MKAHGVTVNMHVIERELAVFVSHTCLLSGVLFCVQTLDPMICHVTLTC